MIVYHANFTLQQYYEARVFAFGESFQAENSRDTYQGKVLGFNFRKTCGDYRTDLHLGCFLLQF